MKILCPKKGHSKNWSVKFVPSFPQLGAKSSPMEDSTRQSLPASFREWHQYGPVWYKVTASVVVIRVQAPRQTKESARRDGAAVARLLCGHMFLLCGAG